MVAQKERIPGVTLARLLAQMKIIEKANSFYQLTALQPALALSSHRLTPIPDIFDRLVVAEAIERGTALITRDATIRECGLVETVWD